MYKYLVFFDLDCTLFDNDSKVNDEVANAMDKIREHGGLPIIATGRALFEITDTLKKTKINTAVTSNGDHGMYENKDIFSRVINPNTIDELVKFADEHGNSVTVLDQEAKATSAHDPLIIKACEAVNVPIPPIVGKEYWHTHPIDMMFVTNTDLDQAYKDKFGDKLTFYRNSKYSIDVVDHGASKATGIENLVNDAGLEGIPTYAFGDGNNDIPMLDYVDHAVVMGNGLKNVKEHGDFITTDNDKHGIVNGLKHFDLI